MEKLSLFDKIDNFLKNKKSSELSLLFVMVFIIIGFLIYSTIFPITDRMLIQSKRDYKHIEDKLNEEKRYLASVTRNGDKNFAINQIASDIKKKKRLLANAKHLNTYIDKKLKELSFILYNDTNWARFLNAITFKAQKYDIKIKLLSNQFFEPDFQKIEQVLNVQIEFSGEFKDILKFINTLEESELVIDIDKLNIQSSNMIDIKLNIAAWGVRY